MERPKHNTQEFEIAINNSELTELELDLLEHIRRHMAYCLITMMLNTPSKRTHNEFVD